MGLRVVYLVVMAAVLVVVTPTQEVMKKLTIGFGRALSECRSELNMGDHIMQDFTNYWKEDYQLLNREFGCMVLCMASKHNLLTEDGLHHDNAHEFAKKHGADDDTAKQLVTMLHECDKNPNAPSDDDCMRALEVSKCFKTKIHELKWAPSMEEIIEEIMTDVKPE
ncbi:general odorant-binding protein 1-like [Aricia agestis]|uniref:general odorant-binding protein 1-like n=1 Tax=Aricia agestis TaxID=91739 RepID=UPI001C205F49|nr:general odorant-binding protein 1-like [Aricia agestis]